MPVATSRFSRFGQKYGKNSGNGENGEDLLQNGGLSRAELMLPRKRGRREMIGGDGGCDPEGDFVP